MSRPAKPAAVEKAPLRTLLTGRALGAMGDGIASYADRSVFVPFLLPGEEAVVDLDVQAGRGRLVSLNRSSSERDPAKCPHYGVCGGCSLQHLAPSLYRTFKLSLVSDPFAARGLTPRIDPMIEAAPHSRRRATFAAARRKDGFVFGFHGRRSHAIVPISACPVLDPRLMAVLPDLAALARLAAPPKGPLVVTATATATGVDAAFEGVGAWFNADDRARLVAAAAASRLARLAIDGEVALELRAPAVAVGKAWVTPPPGGFLQATEAAQAAMARLAAEALLEARKVADLFAGSGAFSLPLAAAAAVHAVESDAAALLALSQAAKRVTGLKPITTERRDLFRQPLRKDELNRFDAVVLDPPRAGAEAQARALADSHIRRCVMVSCNPVTLARDLGILVDSGFRIDRVTPIDQFLWSPHIEVVAALSR